MGAILNKANIFKNTIDVGTIMANVGKAFIDYNPLSSPIDDNFIVNKPLKLNYPISSTPNGIQLDFPESISIAENAVNGYYVGGRTSDYKASIKLAKGSSSAIVYSGYYTVKVIVDDDQTIHFQSSSTKNSTYAELAQLANSQIEKYDYWRYYLILSQITAY